MKRRSRGSRKSRRRRKSSAAPRVFGALLLMGAVGGGVWYGWFREPVAADGSDPSADGRLNLTRDAIADEDRFTNEDASALLAEVDAILGSRDGSNDQAKLNDAYLMMSAALEPRNFNMDVNARRRLLPTFHKLTDALFLSPGWSRYRSTYEVQPNESLSQIGDRFGVTVAMLCRWNNIPLSNAGKIHPGQRLSYVEGPIEIRVDKSEFCLSYFIGDQIARQYIIAHGHNGKTPLGTSTVKNKIVDPDKGTSDPMLLEMDARWMGLRDYSPGATGIGIHGTHEPQSIGKAESHGCVRMFSHEVEELYDLVPLGASVTIES